MKDRQTNDSYRESRSMSILRWSNNAGVRRIERVLNLSLIVVGIACILLAYATTLESLTR